MNAQVDWLAPLSAEKSLKKHGISSMVWLGLSQSAKLLLNLGSTIVLVRLLLPGDFGLMAMAMTVTNFFMLFKDAGLTTAIVQQTTLTQRQVSTLFWLNLMIAAGLGVVCLIAAPLLTMFYGEPALKPVIMLMAVGFLFGGMGVQHAALLRRAMQFRKLALLEIGSAAISVLAAIALAYAGFGWWALVWQQLIQLLAYSLGCWAICRWRPSFAWAWGESHTQFKFGAQVSGFNFVNYFSRYADNISIGYYWGAAALGIYSKAYSTLMAPIRQISGPLATTLQPLLGRLREEPSRYRKAYLMAYTPAVLVMLPIGAMMFVMPEAIVSLLFGKGWEAAVPVLQWMGIGVATQLVGDSTGTLLLSQQRGRDYMYIGMMTSVISVASFFVGLPWGIGAVAGAYILGYVFVQMPLFSWWTGRSGPVRMRDIYTLMELPLWCAGFLLPALLVVRMAVENPLLQLGGGAVAGGAAMLAALACVKEGRELMRSMLDIIQRKIR